MLKTMETDISQETNNFSSQVSINNKIQQLPFNFPVELQKHFPHGVLDAQIGLEKSAFQEQSEGGTEYESVNVHLPDHIPILLKYFSLRTFMVLFCIECD